jgi:hypothetical protein
MGTPGGGSCSQWVSVKLLAVTDQFETQVSMVGGSFPVVYTV